MEVLTPIDSNVQNAMMEMESADAPLMKAHTNSNESESTAVVAVPATDADANADADGDDGTDVSMCEERALTVMQRPEHDTPQRSGNQYHAIHAIYK